jgi:imidazolonepropionase-like amidohydrolase
MRVNVVAFAATLALAAYGSTVSVQAEAPGVTAFEGARIIVGDGSAPIDNGTLVVEAARIAQVGKSADVRVPAGATRVNLAGKTVMPDLIDTHTHLSQTREELILDLRRRAYYVSAGGHHDHSRHRRQHPVAAACSDRGHGARRDDADASHRGLDQEFG